MENLVSIAKMHKIAMEGFDLEESLKFMKEEKERKKSKEDKERKKSKEGEEMTKN